MVHLSNSVILTAAQVAILAAPVFAGPIDTSTLRTRETFELEAREPMLRTAGQLITHGPARKVITDPLKKTVKDQYEAQKHQHTSGPSLAQQALDKSKHKAPDHSQHDTLQKQIKEATRPPKRLDGPVTAELKKQGRIRRALLNELMDELTRRDVEDEYLEARDPMLRTAGQLIAHGPARKVITDPLKKTVKDQYEAQKNHRPSGPSPALAKSKDHAPGHSQHSALQKQIKEATRPPKRLDGPVTAELKKQGRIRRTLEELD